MYLYIYKFVNLKPSRDSSNQCAILIVEYTISTINVIKILQITCVHDFCAHEPESLSVRGIGEDRGEMRRKKNN
jgi:hypothetical protein